MKCTKHPHSSEESAKKCFNKTAGRRADRKLKNIVYMPKIKQIKCSPPELVKLGNVEVYYFYKGDYAIASK